MIFWKRKKKLPRRCKKDEIIVRLCDMYKDFANILDEPFYAAEVARTLYDLTGDMDWERHWHEQFDIWVEGGMK